MSKYSENQLVEAIVERVFPFGVFVRLADGTKAYIRRRELDLDADVDPTQVKNIGDKIDAKIITLGDQNKLIELSIREILPDPWLEFAKQFHEGDTVRGVVQSIHPRGAFVHVARGIRGFVSLKDMANWQVNKPEDILWVGDWIEAVITYLDTHGKRLALSIKARISKYAQTLQIFEKMVNRAVGENETFVAATTEMTPGEDPDPALIARVGSILVVDDDPEVRKSLIQWLSNRGFKVDQADSLESSIRQISKNPYQVVLHDLNLNDQDGLEIARFIREGNYNTYIWMMSSPESLVKRTSEIEAVGVSQVFPKPLDINEIERSLLKLVQDKFVEKGWLGPESKLNNAPNFQDLVTIQLEGTSPQYRLQNSLKKVTELLHAQVGLIFELDRQSTRVSILVQAGDIKLNMEAIYDLDISPVQDVITSRLSERE